MQNKLSLKLKHYNRLKFECQNRIMNVKKQHLVTITLSKEGFEYQNLILGKIWNVKIGFLM